MDRRQVLATLGSVLLGACAGCPAGSDASGDPSGVSPTTTPTNTPEPPTGTPTETATPFPTPTPTPSVEKRETALAAYREGFADRRDYDEATNIARVGYNRGKYQGAEGRYQDAVELGESSAAHFERARDLATETGVIEAQERADKAVAYTRQFLIPFAKRGVDAARAAQNGAFEEAAGHIAEMESITEQATESSLEVVFPWTFEDALGL